MKTYHFLPVFLALVFSYIGLHFYAARWLSRSFSLGHAAAYWLRLALLAAAFTSPFIMFLKRYAHSPFLDVFYEAGYAWMGVILIAAFFFAAADLAAPLLRRAVWFPPGLLAPATLALLAAVTAWSVYCGQKIPAIKEIEVPFRGLPPALEGFRIAQVSDLHLDSDRKLRRLSRIVDRLNAARPDLVLFTGDLLDTGINCSAGLGALTGRIKSRLGLFGSLGNHEYYYGLDRSLACYGYLGIRLLKNDAYDLSSAGEPAAVKDIRLIGLGDVHTEHLTQARVAALLAGFKDGKFNILMTHQPVFYPAIAAAGDYLVLSGHTHKGQVFPFNVLTPLFYKYFYGLYRINNSAFYVTSGAGTWGPPLRWLAPAEIPVIILKTAK